MLACRTGLFKLPAWSLCKRKHAHRYAKMLFNKSLLVLSTMPEHCELHTWQEIADYLSLSVRAVQNYEKTAGLPVHRLTGHTRGRVWAFTAELDAWKSRALAVDGEMRVTMAVRDEESSPLSSPAYSPFTHWRYVGLVSGLYALLCAEGVVLETAYQFDHYRAKAVLGAVVVFCCVLASFFSAVAVDSWRTAQNRNGGLFLCITIVYGSTALLQFGLWLVLPTTAITEQISRQSWSAQSAYLKNLVMYFLPLATFYVLLPFHFVLALQRELAAKRHGPVLALLTGERKATTPGAVHLRVGWLAAALFVVAMLAVVMTQDLFGSSQTEPLQEPIYASGPGPYAAPVWHRGAESALVFQGAQRNKGRVSPRGEVVKSEIGRASC